LWFFWDKAQHPLAHKGPVWLICDWFLSDFWWVLDWLAIVAKDQEAQKSLLFLFLRWRLIIVFLIEWGIFFVIFTQTDDRFWYHCLIFFKNPIQATLL
jgi:hypothetical protein